MSEQSQELERLIAVLREDFAQANEELAASLAESTNHVTDSTIVMTRVLDSLGHRIAALEDRALRVDNALFGLDGNNGINSRVRGVENALLGIKGTLKRIEDLGIHSGARLDKMEGGEGQVSVVVVLQILGVAVAIVMLVFGAIQIGGS